MEVDLPELKDGEILVRNTVMSVDPYMRGRMNDVKSYVPPFQIDQPLDGGAVGTVIASRSDEFAEGQSVLQATLHHIIADGWSMNILIQEFMRGYDAQVSGQQQALPALAVQYRDYGLWQRSWLDGGQRQHQAGRRLGHA